MRHLKIKKLNEDAIIPIYQSEFAAGFDLHSTENVTIQPQEAVIIGTGLSFAIPHGYFGAVYARSGLGCKYGIRLSNSVGIIDEDYRGEVKITLRNDSRDAYQIRKGMRVAQMVIQPYEHCDIIMVDELDNTKRGQGGFGSTGV